MRTVFKAMSFMLMVLIIFSVVACGAASPVELAKSYFQNSGGGSIDSVDSEYTDGGTVCYVFIVAKDGSKCIYKYVKHSGTWALEP